jgi:hypothetical protein
VILHPSQEVILSPLREIIGVGQVAAAGGVSVELLMIEIREAGALIDLRARPVAGVAFMTASVSVSDQLGTAFRALDAGSEGSAYHWAGQSVVMPAPPPGSRLRVEILSFGWPRDDPEERRGASVLGPWRFDIPRAVG